MPIDIFYGALDYVDDGLIIPIIVHHNNSHLVKSCILNATHFPLTKLEFVIKPNNSGVSCKISKALLNRLESMDVTYFAISLQQTSVPVTNDI